MAEHVGQSSDFIVSLRADLYIEIAFFDLAHHGGKIGDDFCKEIGRPTGYYGGSDK